MRIDRKTAGFAARRQAELTGLGFSAPVAARLGESSGRRESAWAACRPGSVMAPVAQNRSSLPATAAVEAAVGLAEANRATAAAFAVEERRRGQMAAANKDRVGPTAWCPSRSRPVRADSAAVSPAGGFAQEPVEAEVLEAGLAPVLEPVFRWAASAWRLRAATAVRSGRRHHMALRLRNRRNTHHHRFPEPVSAGAGDRRSCCLACCAERAVHHRNCRRLIRPAEANADHLWAGTGAVASRLRRHPCCDAEKACDRLHRRRRAKVENASHPCLYRR